MTDTKQSTDIQRAQVLESVLVRGDLSQLSEPQRLIYLNKVCESVGLNPLTRPFEYIKLNGKLTLYAKRDATDQLRRIHNVSIRITAREKIEDVFQVTAQALTTDDRSDESIGAVAITGLKGDALANALMKAETKAKRRVTLSICGLGILDETELETIHDKQPIVRPEMTAESLAKANLGTNHTALSRGADQQLGLQEEDYVIPFGKLAGKRLSEVDPEVLSNYVLWLCNDANSKNKPLTGVVEDFVDRVEALTGK